MKSFIIGEFMEVVPKDVIIDHELYFSVIIFQSQ